MRNAFISCLLEYAKTDKDIIFLTGDMGFAAIEPFANAFPERCINVGICEQNMTGVAAGLSMCGKKVFTYSIVNFAVTRCLEQIRNDLCYHNLDVTVVSIGGGLVYGTLGYTHHGIEDIGFMRSLPNMRVFSPADKYELSHCMNEINISKGPKYLRLPRGGEIDFYQSPVTSCVTEIFQKSPVNVLCTGTILHEAHDAIMKIGGGIGLYSISEISERTTPFINDIAMSSKAIITIEEHLSEGGLGGFVCENNSGASIIRLGISHKNIHSNGSQKYLRAINGIDADSISEILLKNKIQIDIVA